MDILKISPEEFEQLQRAFMGGHTHANHNYVRKILHDVASYDFTSSYPSVMVLEKFPMSPAFKVDHPVSQEEFSRLVRDKCCMFDLELWDVFPKLHWEHPLSRSKCQVAENYVLDNGRIVMADHIRTTCTEQDLKTYLEFYTWGKYEISNLVYYEKQYLPHNFVMAILELYKRKTILKGVEGEELNYMISKNMANAAFGMIVTNPVRETIEYLEHEYVTTKPELIEAIEQYNNSKKRFLFFPWGVWVTAYARRNLFTGIKEVGNDFIYSDTDSIKLLNHSAHKQYFDDYNDNIIKKINDAAAYHKIDPSEFSPLNRNGEPQTIGLWDFEGIYDDFKTLGAKRYLVRKGDRHTLTLAGANKTKAMKWLLDTGHPFENFDDQMEIPPAHSGRLTLTYIDYPTEGDLVDYTGIPYHYKELSSVHMENSEYTLSMSDAFLKYLKGEIELE